MLTQTENHFNKTIGQIYYLLVSPDDNIKLKNLNDIFRVFQFNKDYLLDFVTEFESGLKKNSIFTNQYQKKMKFIIDTISKNAKPSTLQELETELLDCIKVSNIVFEIRYALLEHKINS